MLQSIHVGVVSLRIVIKRILLETWGGDAGMRKRGAISAAIRPTPNHAGAKVS